MLTVLVRYVKNLFEKSGKQKLGVHKGMITEQSSFCFFEKLDSRIREW